MVVERRQIKLSGSRNEGKELTVGAVTIDPLAGTFNTELVIDVLKYYDLHNRKTPYDRKGCLQYIHACTCNYIIRTCYNVHVQVHYELLTTALPVCLVYRNIVAWPFL